MLILVLRSRRINDTAPAPELFFSWTWILLQLRSSTFWFSWVWLLLWSSFFHSMAPASVRFFTLIFSIVLVYIKLTGKWKVGLFGHKTERIYQYEKISEKKQQSRVQTIQRTVTSRNIAQDNGSNINKFWKGSRWFWQGSRQVHICLNFIPSWKCRLLSRKAMLVRFQLVITFMLSCCW